MSAQPVVMTDITANSPNPDLATPATVLRDTGPAGRALRGLISRTGPALRPLAGRRWFPLWGVIHHVGRTSGRAYSTPIVVLPMADGFVVPLPFGGQTQWVRNILAAGGGSLRWAGQDHGLTDPQVIDQAGAMPAYRQPLRSAVKLLGMDQFLRVRRTTRA
jgi:deazaflavin-dependent oxidoreductase (nitroreductase family)